MKLLGYLGVFLCAVAICSGQESVVVDDVNPTETNSTTDSTPTTITAPTTVAPTQSTDPTNTTTTSEAPSTESPGNSTSAPPEPPTTVPPEPTTTTPPPVTPTTPVAPTETPTSPDLKFSINNTDRVCLVAWMEVTMKIQYPTSNGTKVGSVQLFSNDTDLNINLSTKCEPDAMEELLVLNYMETSTIKFHFVNRSHAISVSHVDLDLQNLTRIFPDASIEELQLLYNSSLFETTENFSYKCDAETKGNLVNSSGGETGSSIHFQKVQVQAFSNGKTSGFLSARDCEADDNVSDIVPIAVGCALAGLVVIVLIAYLVGRRQKRQRGYESV